MIELNAPIIKGGWCHIHAVNDRPDLCAKVLSPLRRHNNAYPNPNELVRNKYGIANFLEYEWDNYRKIMAHCPADLQPYFVRMLGLETTPTGQQVLLMERVMDDLGQTAPSLATNTRPLTPEFFAILERIRKDVLVRHAIDHFGIARRNILVKTPSHPVIIDFQTGRERFRGQFWLRHPWFVRRKINRCFDKLYKELDACRPASSQHESMEY